MANINVYGELYNNTPDGYVAPASQIMDTGLGRLQSEINRDLAAGFVNTAYVICDTLGNVSEKTINLTDYYLTSNVRLLIRMEHSHTNTQYTPTLNINQTGAEPIQYEGAGATYENTWEDGELLDVYYDGTKYVAKRYNSSRFANGQQVSDTNLESTPTQNSNNLVTSGGLYNTVQDLNNKIDAIVSGVKVTLTISPSTIYKGTATNITLTGTMTNGTPSTMALKDGSTTLNTSTSSPITYTTSLTLTTNTKSYQVQGVTTTGLTLNSSASVSARYPIYYGFGANSDAVMTSANKLAPTTTAARTYERTNSTGNTCGFFIMIPEDIGTLSSFTMNGAPFAMKPVSNETKGGVLYHVYESGNVYANGVKVTVAAS